MSINWKQPQISSRRSRDQYVNEGFQDGRGDGYGYAEGQGNGNGFGYGNGSGNGDGCIFSKGDGFGSSVGVCVDGGDGDGTGRNLAEKGLIEQLLGTRITVTNGMSRDAVHDALLAFALAEGAL